MHETTRRSFLSTTLKGAAGLALVPFTACATGSKSRDGVLGVPEGGYPLVEAKGGYRDIGRQLGEAMKPKIRSYFGYAPNYKQCLEYLRTGGMPQVQRMLKHTQDRYPQLVEELRGMAEGLDMDFMSLFAYNCKSEISVMARASGCSTIGYQGNQKMVLAHNEDGNDLERGRMYVAHVTPPSGVSFIAFVYPGLLPGNGPGFNSRGVVQTTNYIEPRAVGDGVPRYLIGRAILEALSLDQAVEMATEKGRAFSWHHNLASLPDGILLSVETYPGRFDVLEVEGTYAHTNHFLHPEMAGDGGATLDVPYESSLTRMRVLQKTFEAQGAPTTADAMLDCLSLHEGRPYSPCRHPEGDIHGITLGTAVFMAPELAMTLYHGNPCQGFRKRYTL
jgi:hypothetical protein